MFLFCEPCTYFEFAFNHQKELKDKELSDWRSSISIDLLDIEGFKKDFEFRNVLNDINTRLQFRFILLDEADRRLEELIAIIDDEIKTLS